MWLHPYYMDRVPLLQSRSTTQKPGSRSETKAQCVDGLLPTEFRTNELHKSIIGSISKLLLKSTMAMFNKKFVLYEKLVIHFRNIKLV